MRGKAWLLALLFVTSMVSGCFGPKDDNNLNATANRWKGAFGVILIFGALLGWIGTIILKYIKGA